MVSIESPDDLSTFLMVLKDAGVIRARLGDVEVEFAPTTAAEPEVVYVDAQKSQLTKNEPQPKLTGYGALFNGAPPVFPKTES
jgi:hypothetical protein